MVARCKIRIRALRGLAIHPRPHHPIAISPRPTVALEQATPDGLGYVIAQALQRRAAPRRVLHFVGEDADLVVRIYNNDRNGSDEGLVIEYVPAGVGILKPVRERN